MDKVQFVKCSKNECSSVVINGKSNVTSFLFGVGITLFVVNAIKKNNRSIENR